MFKQSGRDVQTFGDISFVPPSFKLQSQDIEMRSDGLSFNPDRLIKRKAPNIISYT